jgi:predicted permease
MKIFRNILSRLRWLGHGTAVKREIDDELRFHIEQRTAENIAAGMSREEAARSARKRFGNWQGVREECRDIRGASFGETLLQDIRFGLRMLRKNPGFTTVVVLTLALGIGANTAIFSVVNGILFNPLPYPKPEQLISLHQSKPNFSAGAIPYPNFRDWQKQNQTFSAMTISRGYSFSLIGADETTRVVGRLVSADYFSVYEVGAALGRSFTTEEDEPGAAPVAVISDRLWKRKFASSHSVVGSSLTLDEKTYTIIGVLPASFQPGSGIDVLVPIAQWNTPALKSRTAGLGLHGIGRLKPGVTLAQAQADMDGVARRLAADFPDANRGNGAALIPLKELLISSARLNLWLLLGAVGFVLLIACVNVSNLLLGRSVARVQEISVRIALGAGRWRLLRQLLTESTLLALLGGGLGLLVAHWGTEAVLKLLPAALPRAEEVKMDGHVLCFTLGVSVLTGILAGLLPALKMSRWSLGATLKEGGRGTAGGRHRTQGVMVALEMALALVLLIGAGLMIRSLTALWDVDPGFRPENAVTFTVALSPALQQASEETVRANLRALSDQLRSIPGVRAASFSDGASPLQGEDDLFFWIDGQPKPSSTSEMNMALVYRVEPDYLSAMGIPLKEGRFFNERDDQKSQAVVVVDDVFARKYFPQGSPVGKRINLGDERDPRQIVGVVGHVKQWGLDSDDKQSLQAQLYEAYRQLPPNPGNVDVFIRTALATGSKGSLSLAIANSIRQTVQRHNSQNVIYNFKTMNQVLASSLAPRRFSMILLEAFAAAALMLAAIGLYGVMSYAVSQRTREIGLRLALGATGSNVLSLIVIRGLKLAGIGMLVGLVGAICLNRLLEKVLYAVKPTDPLTFCSVSLLLLLVATLASWLPAARAARLNPMEALKYE